MPADFRHFVYTKLLSARAQPQNHGPFRVGPSYPLLFWKEPFIPEINLPAAKHAHFGNRVVLPDYYFHEHVLQSHGAARYRAELESLENFIRVWAQGNEFLRAALAKTPEVKREEAQRMFGLGEFILNSAKTALNVKKWWQRKRVLETTAASLKASTILDEMVAIAKREMENAKATIPLVEADSRLGWEPSMEYMTDKRRLLWKIEQVRRVIDEEIPKYRGILELTEGK